MRNCLIFIITGLLFTCNILAQDYYYVIKCNGKVFVGNKALKSRDKISENDKIKFSSEKDVLFVFHLTKGNIELTPKGVPELESELVSFLRGKYLPDKSTISSRGLELLQKPEDFHQYFENIGYLVLPYNEFHVDTLIYPLSKNNFFFIRYEYHKEVINKKLSFHGNCVLLQPDELYKVDNNAIDFSEANKTQIFYYNGFEKNSLWLSNLVLKVVNENTIKQEIETLLDCNPDPQKAKIFIFQYLNMVYGNFDEDAITKIIAGKK